MLGPRPFITLHFIFYTVEMALIFIVAPCPDTAVLFVFLSMLCSVVNKMNDTGHTYNQTTSFIAFAQDVQRK